MPIPQNTAFIHLLDHWIPLVRKAGIVYVVATTQQRLRLFFDELTAQAEAHEEGYEVKETSPFAVKINKVQFRGLVIGDDNPARLSGIHSPRMRVILVGDVSSEVREMVEYISTGRDNKILIVEE